ncbi:ribonuclease P protein component [Deminuibacter soli]|uniref:ribonuclease P protein component n=1 Tax=Deminuibacter soli TaxID=2291815 RepID=UPI0021CF009B|nr:ribonuclease P protein component [Deminuibacter soli]
MKSRKLLEQLFREGKSFLVFPVKVIYLQPVEPMDFPVKVAVGASGRHFKKAVHRNRVKRLMREAYRLNKAPLHQLVTSQQKQVAVFLLYIDKVLPPNGDLLQQKMPVLINKLVKELNENITPHT